jgi:diaminopimelate decarboxylase
MKIYISGLYSGTNPQPGVGIIRSLRQAYPDAKLIGMEYSTRCSGIHWDELDEVVLHRPWNELNLDQHAKTLTAILDEGSYFISGTDLEAIWISTIYPEGHPNLLIPPAEALRQVAKPAVPAHLGLPVKIPPFVTTDISDWDLHTFCRQHDWKVWLKGPYYEAVRVRNWAELESMRTLLTSAWSTQTLFLQAHVSGYEESVALAAYKGELLHCVTMHKRDLTEMSKTWAGDIAEVPASIKEPLRNIIKDINWTGGAELEMVRDADDQLWLLEWNPRFPAWIHGATIAGHNMSAILVEGATGIPYLQSQEDRAQEFTRVVMEIPVKKAIPLSPLPEPFSGGIGHSLKHPSGLLGFAEKLHKINEPGHRPEETPSATPESNYQELPVLPDTYLADMGDVNFPEISTPSFLFFERTANSLFEKAQVAATSASTNEVKITNAYSIKTNPDERMLKSALAAGFLAEAISPMEVHKAIEAGFSSEQVILNGPGKWWRKEFLPATPLHAVFCDSLADLNRVVEALASGTLRSKIVGVRLRTPNVVSRFGIPIHTPEFFGQLIEAIKKLPRDSAFGVHFHMASSNIGVANWMHLFEAMVRWCTTIEAMAGRSIECLDMGGGWAPDDWELSASNNRLAKALSRVQELLPNVSEIICEPGKALAQPSMALAMRILEMDNDHNDPKADQEVIVDASIAELPMHFVHPHRILYQKAGETGWQPLGRGKAQLLGRLCMEHDIVATNVALPQGAKAGDLLVFCDAGAYDKSMSYVFGHG